MYVSAFAHHKGQLYSRMNGHWAGLFILRFLHVLWMEKKCFSPFLGNFGTTPYRWNAHPYIYIILRNLTLLMERVHYIYILAFRCALYSRTGKLEADARKGGKKLGLLTGPPRAEGHYIHARIYIYTKGAMKLSRGSSLVPLVARNLRALRDYRKR